jgi:hypothetical protein
MTNVVAESGNELVFLNKANLMRSAGLILDDHVAQSLRIQML